jgi:hypothetical protein
MEKKLDVMVHTCYHSDGRKHKIEGLQFRLAWAKSELNSKITRVKRIGCMIQVVECLPSKHKVLISNTSTAQKKA